VPDLTFVGRSENGRLLPNPNVLIEYGWALKELSHSRIIPVMNTAFGEANAETLPFDMRHLRHPLTYHVGPSANAGDRASEKDALVKELVNAISTIFDSGVVESVQHPGFPEVEPTDNPSTFLASGEVLARLPGNRFDPERVLFLPDVERLFLRLVPTRQVEAIESATVALDMIRSGRLSAMGETAGTHERNKPGALVCKYGENNNEVLMLTQLFLSRELWGIDTYTIRKEILIENVDVSFGFFRWTAFQNCFVAALTDYVKFAQQQLNLEPPLRFIAGATDVEGYRMTAPIGMPFTNYDSFKGNVVNPHIVYESEIADYEVDVETVLRPFFVKVWDECGLPYYKDQD